MRHRARWCVDRRVCMGGPSPLMSGKWGSGEDEEGTYDDRQYHNRGFLPDSAVSDEELRRGWAQWQMDGAATRVAHRGNARVCADGGRRDKVTERLLLDG